jgi:hypothetical protein
VWPQVLVGPSRNQERVGITTLRKILALSEK